MTSSGCRVETWEAARMAEQQTKKERTMKVTMVTCMAGPDGVARQGTVLDVPETTAKEWIDGRFAVAYDKELHKRNPHGLVKAKDNFGDQI